MKPIILSITIGIIIFSAYLAYLKNIAPNGLENRQQMIHEKGSAVMPFDLNKTTHVFNQTDSGGIQQVKVKDVNDTEQILLIREHLQQEAENFTSGNFEDPENLHGEYMPGLELLRNNPEKFTVKYVELKDGAQLNYITKDPEVVEAFHDWFMAQLMDHGSDATHMMN